MTVASVVQQAPYVVDDALATVFGAGVHQDTVEATWDDAPLRQREITPRSASNFLREQARGLARPKHDAKQPLPADQGMRRASM